jgi:quercetin dioxygenase-like cupin family protein
MKIFRAKDYIDLNNPTPGESYRPEILTTEHMSKNMGGMLGILPPGSQVPYHFHNIRESVIFFIAGEGIETVEGEEFPVKAGDILFIPAGENYTKRHR